MVVRERMLNQRLAEKKIREHDEKDGSESFSGLADKSILLINNNAFERLLITELLHKQQGVIVSIDDIDQIMAELEQQQYNLILLDSDDFPNVADILRAITPEDSHTRQETGIIVMTSDAKKWQSQEQMDNFHITGYINKPFKPGQFFAELIKGLSSSNKNLSKEIPVNNLMRQNETQPQKTLNHETASSEENIQIKIQDLPILDRKTALRRVMGDEGMLERLLNNFKKEFQHAVSGIVEEAENNDWATVKRMVHTLKGASGAIGGDRLQKACMEMEERLCCEQDLQTLQPDFDTLAEVLAELLAEISPKEEEDAETSGKADGSHSLILQLYRQFGADIKAGKYKQGQNLLKELQKYNWPEDEFPELGRLQELLQAYTFDKASDLLGKLAEESEEE